MSGNFLRIQLSDVCKFNPGALGKRHFFTALGRHLCVACLNDSPNDNWRVFNDNKGKATGTNEGIGCGYRIDAQASITDSVVG